MAPEQALGKSVDHRCDIYSLGIVAYEMLLGTAPFTDDSPLAVLLKHVNEPLPVSAADRLPAPVMHAIQKAAAKDPAERWPSAGQFVKALEEGFAVAGSAVGVIPPAGGARARRGWLSWPGRLSLKSAAVLGAVAAAGAAATWMRESPRPPLRATLGKHRRSPNRPRLAVLPRPARLPRSRRRHPSRSLLKRKVRQEYPRHARLTRRRSRSRHLRRRRSKKHRRPLPRFRRRPMNQSRSAILSSGRTSLGSPPRVAAGRRPASTRGRRGASASTHHRGPTNLPGSGQGRGNRGRRRSAGHGEGRRQRGHRSSGSIAARSLNTAATEAVRQSKDVPGTRNGVPEEATTNIAVRFRLKD